VTASTKPFAWLIAITSLIGLQVQGQEPLEHMTADQKAYETAYDSVPLAAPPHLVLEPPKLRRNGDAGSFRGEVVTESGQYPTTETSSHQGVLPHEKVAEHFLHADKTARAVAIPGATRAPVWKTPYSYGHFGASRNRQWAKHHGFNNDYTQWTLR